ncbi:MAG: glycosyltransferase family A protein [Verrucomicrobiota bacterium]
MRISLAMIVCNGEAFLEEALDSLYQQTRPPDEIIVWDDGSTDSTPSILTSHQERIRMIQGGKNQGPLLARRSVVEAAFHQNIAFLDSDDRLHPEALAAFSAAASESSGIDLHFGKMRNFYDASISTAREEQMGPWIHGRTNGNLFAKKEAFLAASHAAENAERSEFVSWYQACKRLELRELQIDAPILERRIHQSNASRHPETKREMIHLLKKHLDKKRGLANE